jgi:RNA polymerase sigma-70 factor (ECF subfamily)
MKVWPWTRPLSDVPLRAAAVEARARTAATPVWPREPAVSAGQANTVGSFAALYDEWFGEVARWLRALGAPDADNEDLAQEVFLVVRRRLHDFDGRSVAGWLYRIASRQVAAHRRRRWFRSVVGRRPTVELDELPDAAASPAVALEKKDEQRLLWRLVEQLGEKRRATFVLFEIEGYSGEEIAAVQGIPVATVWTRLHHARKEFFALVDEHRRSEERGARS